MKVLSLFDGMSCGQIALRELGITPEQYYASEIDRHAIAQTQLNFPDTIQLGDVVFLRKAMCWRSDTVEKMKQSSWISDKTKAKFARLRAIDWKAIDLVLAGSPCQGFSFAGKQLAFDDPRSRLFFEFIKILNHIRSLNPDVKFLLENVNMKRSHMRIISEYCGVFPVNINSNLVSAQNRDRWYWTNIRTKQVGLFGELHSDIPQPEDEGILLRDILEEEVDEKYYVSQAVIDRMNRKTYSSPAINPKKTGAVNTKNNSGQMSLNSGTTFISEVVFDRGKIRKTEHGKSQCICANYCKGLDNHGQRTGILENICVAMRGRNPENPSDKRTGMHVEQRLEPNMSGKTNCLTSVQKDNLILQRSRGNNKGGLFEEKTPTLSSNAWEQNNLLCERQKRNLKADNKKANAFLSTSYKGSQANGMTLVKDIIQLNPSKDSGGVQPYQQDRIYDVKGISPTLCVGHGGMTHNINTDRIRRLTPTECSRLQTVPSWYRWACSDTQIYRMLGNGWTVKVIVHILSFFN